MPLATAGYQVYVVGELHGIEENDRFQIQYLRQLHRASGLRDVAIEEDAVYESDAQAFVDGSADRLPHSLCLRASILEAIRKLNAQLPASERIRVHLTDIDSPASAIRQHLILLKNRLNATQVSTPSEASVAKEARTAMSQLSLAPGNEQVSSDQRTIEFSVKALEQGFEVHTGISKGSPYLEPREDAVTQNIRDLVRNGCPVLAIYGADHASRTQRNDGGAARDQPFDPMARRLERLGVRVYSIITFPLSGPSQWRGWESDLLWSATDGQLSSGEPLDQVIAAAPAAELFMIDPKRERARLPSQDVSRMAPDAFILFRSATPIRDLCRAAN